MEKHKIKHIVSFFFLLIAFCNTFCNNKSAVYRQLEEVEQLFSENRDSMAVEILKKITPPKDTTAALALYNYLYAKMYARDNKFLPSNILDYSIEYFFNTNDSLRLSYAFNYKSVFLLNENDKKEARKLNYASERIASNLNDDLLHFNIYSNGYLIAAHHYDTDECLTYANKAYLTGIKLHDTKRMAYPAVFLTMCYNEKNIPDSVKKYMAVCLNFINDYNDYTRSMVYNVFGDVLSQTDDAMSEHYYKESVSINHNEDAYNGLTRLYLKQGKIEQADTCYQKALRPKAYESNLNLMEIYANELENNGNYLHNALKIRKNIYETQDSLHQEKIAGLDERIQHLELDNSQANAKIERLKSKLSVYRMLLLPAITTAIIFGIALYRKNKKEKDSIACLPQKEKNDKHSENKNINYENKAEDAITTGKMIHDKIIAGESIAQLKTEERKSFVRYYQNIDNECFAKISASYYVDKLPVNAVIVLILQHMGKDKNFIIDVMGFSDQAYRSLKSRTEKAKK